jgi:hypothetical protein
MICRTRCLQDPFFFGDRIGNCDNSCVGHAKACDRRAARGIPEELGLPVHIAGDPQRDGVRPQRN